MLELDSFGFARIEVAKSDIDLPENALFENSVWFVVESFENSSTGIGEIGFFEFGLLEVLFVFGFENLRILLAEIERAL
jgi:hypothetical protein